MERFESEHRSDNSFDGPVILLNKVIQILILTDLDFLTGFFNDVYQRFTLSYLPSNPLHRYFP